MIMRSNQAYNIRISISAFDGHPANNQILIRKSPKIEEKHDMSNLWSNYPAVDSDLVTGFGFLSTIPSPRFISLELERISFVMSWHKWELNKHTGNNIQQIDTLVILIHINTTLRFVAPSKSMADRLGVCKVCMCMRKINTKLSAGSSRKNFRHFTI